MTDQMQTDSQTDRQADGQTDRFLEILHSKKVAVLASDEHVFFAKYSKLYHLPVQNRII
jgi:hypothetical protein